MPVLNFGIDTDKLMGVNISRYNEYSYVNVSTKDGDVYTTCSVEWKHGSAIPDVVMDMMDLAKPSKEKASLEVVTPEAKEEYARLAAFFTALANG